jgi:hypothetical protein
MAARQTMLLFEHSDLPFYIQCTNNFRVDEIMAESIQKKLLRVRPPRVKITYDVETGGALKKRKLT